MDKSWDCWMTVIVGSAFPDTLTGYLLLSVLVGLKPVLLMPIFLQLNFLPLARPTILFSVL